MCVNTNRITNKETRCVRTAKQKREREIGESRVRVKFSNDKSEQERCKLKVEKSQTFPFNQSIGSFYFRFIFNVTWQCAMSKREIEKTLIN